MWRGAEDFQFHNSLGANEQAGDTELKLLNPQKKKKQKTKIQKTEEKKLSLKHEIKMKCLSKNLTQSVS